MTDSDILGLLAKTPPLQIIRTLPAVIQMMDEQGRDFRPQAGRILNAMLPLLHQPSLQERIERLYEQLDCMDRLEDPAQASYLLDRLRELEQQEADQYAREFDAWRPLKDGALDAALEHARSLLKK